MENDYSISIIKGLVALIREQVQAIHVSSILDSYKWLYKVYAVWQSHTDDSAEWSSFVRDKTLNCEFLLEDLEYCQKIVKWCIRDSKWMIFISVNRKQTSLTILFCQGTLTRFKIFCSPLGILSIVNHGYPLFCEKSISSLHSAYT